MLGANKIVSFGDNQNDLPMFSVSDESYTVEGAPDELKAVSSGILENVENECVAKWLKDNWL